MQSPHAEPYRAQPEVPPVWDSDYHTHPDIKQQHAAYRKNHFSINRKDVLYLLILLVLQSLIASVGIGKRALFWAVIIPLSATFQAGFIYMYLLYHSPS